MIILTIKTDQPQAEVGVYRDDQQLAYRRWQAHRELAETLNGTIIDVLREADIFLHQLQAVVVYKGPGSFTGLRIGISVANALSYALKMPVVSTQGEDWLGNGIDRVLDRQNETVATPEYGSAPHITAPKR